MLCGTVGLMFGLAGCEQVSEFDLFNKKTDEESAGSAPASSSVKLVERDVEAPDVFQVSDQGLWDGRPSLGGVWVAHPDVKDPERVIIRNEDNGKFVIGALFRRERANPGPKLQVSSDAAAALGMLAGAPSFLNVTALRREQVPLANETAGTELQAPEAIATASLDPIAAAGAAIERSEADQTAALDPTPQPAAAPPRPSNLAKPFIQIGLFSVQENANRTGTVLRGSGVVPNIVKESSKGKTFWRVTIGPATSSAERAALLKTVKGLGYNDAYFVTK